MFEQLTQYNDIGLLILRLAVAIIFVYHALPKLKNAKGMAPMMGMPAGRIFMLGGRISARYLHATCRGASCYRDDWSHLLQDGEVARAVCGHG